MTQRIGLAVLLVTALAAGCNGPSAAVRHDNPEVIAGVSPDVVKKAATVLLMELRFTLDYPQMNPDRVSTEPLTGDSWFEFWRADTIGNYQRAESSLATIRRTATVFATPKDGGTQVLVKVTKQRLSAPMTAAGGIGESVNLYDRRETDLVRQNDLAPEKYKWIDKGRDEALEQLILERLNGAVASLAPAKSAPPATPPASASTPAVTALPPAKNGT
jgi:hypothetical protein